MTQLIYSSNRKILVLTSYQVYLCASPKAIMNPEQIEPSSSPASPLALNSIEEGIRHNVERSQELQEELAQRRASREALQGKASREALLANIIEEEMAHQTQVLVLSRYTCSRLRKLNLNLMR